MATSTNDRNVLLGLLAVQRKLIDDDALTAAMQVWQADRSRPLGQILVERKALSAEQLPELEALVNEQLKANDNDGERTLATLGIDDSVRQQIVRFDALPTASLPVPPGADGTIGLPATPAEVDQTCATAGEHPPPGEHTLATDESAGSKEPMAATFAVDDSVQTGPEDQTVAAAGGRPPSVDEFATEPPSITDSQAPTLAAPGVAGAPPTPLPALRYRILRAHAKGGLGEVFLARDEELGREVALKEIQARFADSPEQRARFLQEAEITGGLEHPGVVPVYGLGQYGDGRPYYAMRFIRGDSLKDAIEAFHKKGDLETHFAKRSLELRELLGRFVAVCNAIAYA
ncbi:MAG: protein kinase, partial [Gemmataceae bacterium]